jgi:hypothetical protein
MLKFSFRSNLAAVMLGSPTRIAGAAGHDEPDRIAGKRRLSLSTKI